MKAKMIKISFLAALFFQLTGLQSCNLTRSAENEADYEKKGMLSEQVSSKPYARYWWFASEMDKKDIRFNLDWLKENGFGGVELAWVYPLNSKYTNLDSSYTHRQEWLSLEWQEIVEFTVLYSDSIGLACDLTMGTLWPFGDSYVNYDQASKRFGEDERQAITRSWEYPQKGYVIDHINPNHYIPYFNRLLDSFPQPQLKLPQAYFVDSWEVQTNKLWTDGLDTEFEHRYGYEISPFMDHLHVEANNAILYDYRKLISEKVIRFYSDFDSVLNERKILSRGQCSGAPCDIIAAYACLDIPEGEAMLFEPEFNSIPASAALLAGKNMTSAETFTCLYGWPDHYMREEQTADLKLVADALFANGINKIIWHGKAHNPDKQDSINFYATVHLGADGDLAEELPSFNQYLTTVSNVMGKGKTYSDVAVYLPTEDAWIKGIMPKEQQFIWAHEFYEMRYIYFPDEVTGHHPIWINYLFLARAKWENDLLKVGDANFRSLYVDARHLDISVLKRITELAEAGLPVTLKQSPIEAGTVQHAEWELLMENLQQLPNVTSEFTAQTAPLVNAENIPAYWARETDQSLYIFFAHPMCKNIKFPLEYGQSYSDEIVKIPISIHYNDKTYKIDLVFPPNQSLLYEIINGQIHEVDISFHTKNPLVKDRPRDFEAPWLIM
jgi:hypothetical protein